MIEISTNSDSVRKILQDLLAKSKIPGIQYLVVDADNILFEFNGGLADIRNKRQLDLSSTMMAYSMSKTITAVAVLQLVEQNKIALDSPLDNYVNISPYGSGVTIRQLLAHTSGIPNPIPLRWVHLASDHAAFDERAALVAVLEKHPRPSFAPGAKYAYSNIGYWLLGSVVSRISGQSFVDYVTENVFGKLGLTSNELGYTIAERSHHACGYLEKYSLMNLAKRVLIDRELIGDYQGAWLRINDHYPNGPAFGGVVGTARGFAKFLQDQFQGRSALLSESGRALLYEQQHTTEGIPVAMTLGWHLGNLNSFDYYYKEGGGGGFHNMMRLYRSSGIGTVVMANATGFNVRSLLDRVDALFI